MSALTDVIEALRAAGLTVYDSEVGGTAPVSYAVVSDRDAGQSRPHRADPGTNHWTLITIDVRCVDRTRNGQRELARRVRAALTGKRLAPGEGVFQEFEASPDMPSTSPDDRRHELVIGYRAHYQTEGAIRP